MADVLLKFTRVLKNGTVFYNFEGFENVKSRWELPCEYLSGSHFAAWNGDTYTTIIAVASIATSGLTIGIGVLGPAIGEGRAVATALSSLAQQPDASATITRTLFVGLAMIESLSIYCFVVSMILIFANPFWNTATV